MIETQHLILIISLYHLVSTTRSKYELDIGLIPLKLLLIHIQLPNRNNLFRLFYMIITIWRQKGILIFLLIPFPIFFLDLLLLGFYRIWWNLCFLSRVRLGKDYLVKWLGFFLEFLVHWQVAHLLDLFSTLFARFFIYEIAELLLVSFWWKINRLVAWLSVWAHT